MRPRILVVDDEPLLRGVLTQALRMADFEVDCASDAENALQLAGERRYAVALLDFQLGTATGVDLHIDLRTVDTELAANTLFMSGGAEVNEYIDYISENSRGLLRKPFPLARLRKAILAIVHDR